MRSVVGVRRRGVRWLVLAVTVACAALTSGSYLLGGSFMPEAPSAASPPFPGLWTALATYDVADHADLWFFPNGATWVYADGGWSNVTLSAGIPVNLYSNALLTYDARDGYAVLFGGETPKLAPLSETWTFADGRWTNLTASVQNPPPPHHLDVMAYDSEDHEVVLFGGSIAGKNLTNYNETWTYAAGAWTNVSAPGPAPVGQMDPNAQFDHLVDDPALGYLLYYDSLGRCSGNTSFGLGSCATTWAFRGGDWTNLTPSLVPSPRIAIAAAFAYDSTSGAVVTFSLCGNSSTYTCAHESGTFEFTGTGWKDITPSSGPAPRDFGSSVDDPADGGIMMVGGCCWADFSGFSLRWDDVWVYAQGSWSEREPWGGGPPVWGSDDGFWIGVGTLSASTIAIVYVVRRIPRPEP